MEFFATDFLAALNCENDRCADHQKFARFPREQNRRRRNIGTHDRQSQPDAPSLSNLSLSQIICAQSQLI